MRFRSAVVLVILALSLLSAAPAQDTEQRIKMEDLPAAVKKAVLEASKGLKLRGLSREVEKGKAYYEAEIEVHGRTRDVTFDETGALVLIEEEIPLAELPAAVRAAIEKGAEGGKILLVEFLKRNNKIEAYEAHVEKDGKEIEFKVDPQGKPIVEK